MRRLLVLLAACTPDIAPGAYMCGPEGLCPEGLSCNGPDNLCVLPSQVRPFDCGVPDPTGDDAPEVGRQVGGLTCVSPIRETHGCLQVEDPGDWFQFDIPSNCVAVQIEARITFPLAFEAVGIELSTDGGPSTRVDTDCPTSLAPDDGEVSRCVKVVVENGSHHALGLVHSSEGDCGGNCANNRYLLELQLSTP